MPGYLAGGRRSLAAAYPIIPWSDLSDALVPNGRDGSVSSLFSPPGVSIGSYVNALYVAGAATGGGGATAGGRSTSREGASASGR